MTSSFNDMRIKPFPWRLKWSIICAGFMSTKLDEPKIRRPALPSKLNFEFRIKITILEPSLKRCVCWFESYVLKGASLVIGDAKGETTRFAPRLVRQTVAFKFVNEPLKLLEAELWSINAYFVWRKYLNGILGVASDAAQSLLTAFAASAYPVCHCREGCKCEFSSLSTFIYTLVCWCIHNLYVHQRVFIDGVGHCSQELRLLYFAQWCGDCYD